MSKSYEPKTETTINCVKLKPHQKLQFFCKNQPKSFLSHRTFLFQRNNHSIIYKCKITCITYKIVCTAQPAYHHSVLKQYSPSRRLRSSDCSLLAVPRVRTRFRSHSFAVAAPTTWNALPLHIRNSSSIFGFRRQLKINSKPFSSIN